MRTACKWRTLVLAACQALTGHRRYFIKDGRVSESGTHDQLLSMRGGYYEYVQLQALSKK